MKHLKKRINFICLGGLIALLGIAACEQISVGPVTPPAFADAEVVTLGSDTTPRDANESVVDGTDKRYQVNLPATFTNDLLYVEVSPVNAPADSVRLEMYDANGDLVRQSSSPDFFTGQGITINPIDCRGPCILLDANTIETGSGGVVYLRVSTTNGTPVEFDLFVYQEDYGDEEEPANDINCTDFSTSAIVVTPSDDEYEGAIETVEDLDCYQSDGAVRAVTIETFADTTIDLLVNAYDRDTGDQVLTRLFVAREGGSESASFDVGASFRRVEVQIFGYDSASREVAAAPAAQSGYRISFDFPQ